MKGMLFEATFEDKNISKVESKIITLNKHFQPEGIFSEEEVKEKEEMASNICPKPNKDYDDLSLLPVGQDLNIPDKNYIPKDLREINNRASTKNGICLIKEARDNFEEMVDQAKK